MQKKTRVLIVEDDNTLRECITDQLAIHNDNTRVVEAKNGIEAINKLQKEDFDLIITDIEMPKMDGVEFIKLAQKIENPPKIIVMSGHLTLDLTKDLFKNGNKDILVKPFAPDTLTAKLEEVLAR